jgi:hypothetical protein
MGNELMVGSCDGTGAAINVILGWIPDSVHLFNIEDAGSLAPELYWVREMAQVGTFAQGVKITGTTDADRALLTTTGIAAYAGGDEIFWDEDNSFWENAAGTDKTEVYVNGAHRRFTSGDAAFQDYGFEAASTTKPIDGDSFIMPEGFTIGADADLNVNGEQLVWVAMKTRE